MLVGWSTIPSHNTNSLQWSQMSLSLLTQGNWAEGCSCTSDPSPASLDTVLSMGCTWEAPEGKIQLEWMEILCWLRISWNHPFPMALTTVRSLRICWATQSSTKHFSVICESQPRGCSVIFAIQQLFLCLFLPTFPQLNTFYMFCWSFPALGVHWRGLTVPCVGSVCATDCTAQREKLMPKTSTVL